ncbi:MAG: methyltransferase domain-containing protein [Blautia sp.]
MSREYTGERFLPQECQGEMAAEHYQRYRFAARLVKGKKVLDAACGEGYGSSLLAEEAAEVTGLDIDSRTVENAGRKYGNEKLSYKNGSIEQLPFADQSFDVVVSFETIEHVGEKIQQKFLEEIRRVLKPEGMLIMSTPNRAVYTDLVEGENPFHIKEFYVNEFQEFLGSRFTNIAFYCQYPDLGYFLTREGEAPATYNKKGKTREESRYVIALCSNGPLKCEVETSDLTIFENQMYYELNRYAHEKEREIRKMKEEADTFQQQLENNIQQQKEYIAKLEDDLRLLKEPYKALLLHWRHPVKYLREKIKGK